MAFLGDKIGIPMYIAAVIVFGGRIFDNFATIRRLVIEKVMEKRNNLKYLKSNQLLVQKSNLYGHK